MADYLSRPRNSTSLWRDGATGADLGIGTSDVAEVLDVSDTAWVDVNGDDPCLHIQLVKNKFSGYTVLVDGLRHYPIQPSPQTQTGNGIGPLTQDQIDQLTECRNELQRNRVSTPLVLIDRHKGMNKDKSTNTVVFSPCVVSVLVEDGYRLPQRCYVEVHQTLHGYKLENLSGVGSMLLGVSEFDPTPITSNHASCVFVPYPIAYSRTPYVILTNNLSQQVASIVKSFKPAVLVSLPWIMINTPWLAPLAAQIFPIADFGPTGATEPERWNLAYYLVSSLLGGLGFNAMAEASSFPRDFATGDDIGKSMTNSLWNAVQGYLKRTDPPEAKTMHYKLPDLIRIITSLGVFVYPSVEIDEDQDDPKQGDFSSISNLKDEWLFWTWLNSTPWLSILDTTKHLYDKVEEIQGEVTTLEADPNRDENRLQELKTQLQQLEEGTYTPPTSWAEYLKMAAPVVAAGAAGALVAGPAGALAAAGAATLDVAKSSTTVKKNSLDFTNVTIDVSSSIQIHLKLGVEDEDCQESQSEFVFRCENETHMRGALASDVIGQIETLWDAVHGLECSLLEALNRNNRGVNKLQRVASWIWRGTVLLTPGFGSKQIEEMLTGFNALNNGTISSALKSFEEKMWKRFGGKDWRGTNWISSDGGDNYVPKTELEILYKRLFNLRANMRPNPPPSPPGFYTRNMPHRIYGDLLFPTSRQFEIGQISVETSSIVLNLASDVKDAIRVASSSLRDGKLALGRLRDIWEEGQNGVVSRCRFVHGTSAAYQTVLAPFRYMDSFALVVAAPVDIRTETVRTRMNEQNNTLIDLVLRSTSTKSLFDTSDERLVAMSVYASIWAEELVKLEELPTQQANLVGALEAASSRVHSRIEKCNLLVQETTKRPHFGFFVPQDVALLATQQGRDAATLARIAHLPNKKGVYVVEFLRNVAAEAKGAIAAWKSNVPLAKMPSEPLQSLFWPRKDGVRAFRRVKSLIQATVSIFGSFGYPVPEITLYAFMGAVSASYPSNVLMDTVAEEAVPRDGPQPAEAWVQIDDSSIYKRLKQRLAALCFDYQSLTLVQNFSVDRNTTDDIVDKLARTSIKDGSVDKLYYIPFGHGASPPLDNAQSNSLMFGSVPVWTSRVVSSIGAVLENKRIDNSCIEINAYHVDCLKQTTVGQAMESSTNNLLHPLVIQYTHIPGSDSPKIDFSSSIFDSSSFFGDFDNYTPSNNIDASTASQTAREFVVSPKSMAFSNMVSSVAWNAERVLQCICVSAVHAPGNEVRIDIGFVNTEYAASVEAGVVLGIAMASSLLQTAMPEHVSVSDLQHREKFTLLNRVLESNGVPSAFRLSELCGYVAVMLY